MTTAPPPRAHRFGHLLAAAGLAAGLLVPLAAPASAADVPTPVNFHSAGNPILSDGSYYTADAAPLVVGDKMYIYTGHDEAEPQQGGFVMHDYAVYSTDDVAGGDWSLYKGDLNPAQVFSWANGNNAYAGQAVAGPDGKFYWYVPVQSKDTTAPNAMAIGVAVSDTPVGPWKDAIGKPLLAWSDVYGTSTQGQELIDPAILQDDDGKTYLYFGSWGVARAVQLTDSMTATQGGFTVMSGLDNFFEAPWAFKRNGIYYMAYDWKQGGSSCTPSNYQACIGYATSDSPQGPWKYRGLILGGTSATTVHPSIIQFDNQWYITYHTKDAVGGGHFRRSAAIDKLYWDGDKIVPVVPTRSDDPKFRLTSNVAPDASVSASFTEQPPMRLGALNDGRALTAMLPPDEWGNFRGTESSNESDWVSYQWDAPVRVDGSGIQFQQDSNWIRPPASWHIEYLDSDGNWQPVTGATYPTTPDQWNTLSFDPVTTTGLRATFDGRPEGAFYHSVAVSEWEVYAADADAPAPVAVSTRPGTAPQLPGGVRLSYPSAPSHWASVNWKAIDPTQYAQAGSFTVEGRVEGYANSMLTATVTVDPNATPPTVTDTTAPTTVVSLSGTQGKDGWFSTPVTARVAADDDVDYLTDISTRQGDGDWMSTPAARHVDLTIDAEGSTDVSGKAADAAGNISTTVTRTVKIDTTAPTATVAVDSTSRAATVSGSDDLSGLDEIQFRFDGSSTWQSVASGSPIAAPDQSPHTLIYRVLDKAGNATTGRATVPPGAGVQLTGNVAQYATPSASYTSGWEKVKGLNDGTAGVLEQADGKLGDRWGTWPQVGEQWARLDWQFPVTVDKIGVWWAQDANDSDNSGLIAPRSWKLRYLDADGVTWRDVVLTGGSTYARTRDTFVPVDFAKVTTTALRIDAQSWGAADSQGSTGIREWQVIAAAETPTPDTTAPTVTATADPADPNGSNGWYTSPITVTPSATDDTDPAPAIAAKVDGGDWAVVSGPLHISGDGTHTVKLLAADKSGNLSPEVDWSAKIDGTAPVSKAVWGAVDRSVTLLSADELSGVARVQYSIGTGAWQDYSQPFRVGQGVTSLRYRATDVAGNVETTRTLALPGSGVVLKRPTLSAVLSSSSVGTGSAASIAVSVTGSGGTATGSLRITEGDAEVASGQLAAGRAVLTVPTSLTPGLHRLNVQYAGDSTYSGVSRTVLLRVVKATSVTTVTLSGAAGFGVDRTAAIAVDSGAGVLATGRVVLKVDGRRIADGMLSEGSVVMPLPALGTGQHQITAQYVGDDRSSGSTASAAIEVTKAASTTAVVLDPARVVGSARATATVQVSVAPSTVVAGGAVPVTVTSADGTNRVFTARLKDGKATLTLPAMRPGSYAVSAAYPGTADIADSSGSAQLTVVAAG